MGFSPLAATCWCGWKVGRNMCLSVSSIRTLTASLSALQPRSWILAPRMCARNNPAHSCWIDATSMTVAARWYSRLPRRRGAQFPPRAATPGAAVAATAAVALEAAVGEAAVVAAAAGVALTGIAAVIVTLATSAQPAGLGRASARIPGHQNGTTRFQVKRSRELRRHPFVFHPMIMPPQGTAASVPRLRQATTAARHAMAGRRPGQAALHTAAAIAGRLPHMACLHLQGMATRLQCQQGMGH